MICIFSVVHNTQRQGGGIELHKSELGFYDIAGVGDPGSEARPYAVCLIPEVLHDKIYVGQDAPDGKYYRFEPVAGREFAQAIVDACQLGGGGIAVAAGELPTPEEVDAAQERYARWLGAKLDEGHKIWAETRNPARIEHFSRVGAEVLGITAEWMPPTKGGMKKRCENCEGMVPVKAAWCPTCNFVFDRDRARTGGHLQTLQADAAMVTAASALDARQEGSEASAAAGGRGRGR